jgi:plasmid stability protein
LVSILVRDLDGATVERLKERARQHGRSLQGEAKAILERSARTMTMAEARAAAERIRQKLAGREFSDSTDLIREDRDR